MNGAESKSNRWIDSLLRIIDSLCGLVQSRFELFAIELQEEKLRALNLLIGLGLALGLGLIGLLVATAALAIFVWDLAQYVGLIALALAALASAAGLLWAIRRRVRKARLPFSDTVAEFQKDRECLRQKH